MKTPLGILCAVLIMVSESHAASWIVWPGQSLQAAITNAAAGDNITLKEGNYVENITLTKGLDIRGETGKELTTSVQGTWTISNAVAPVYLKGFKIGVSTSGNVTITNCTDVRMDYITASPSALAVSGTKFYLYRSSFSGNAAFNGGNVTVQRSTVGGNLTSDNVATKLLASTVTGNVSHNTFAYDCTIFQSGIGEKLYVVATNYWVGYNTIRYAEVRDGAGSCEIVGNRFFGRSAELTVEGGGILIVNTSPMIRNNIIQDYMDTYCIRVSSGNPKIINNVVRNITGDNVPRQRYGIVIEFGSSTAQIIGNIIRNTPAGAFAAPSSAIIKYNNREQGYSGGCSSLYDQTGDPLFTGDCLLQAASPCRNAHDPAHEFDDLDGTRGDLGLWGGHSYDPNGRTTTNPVVMATSAVPLYVKRGQNVMLKARGAVAAP